MKKRLTEAQFQSAIRDLDVGEQTRAIAHAVLVQGRPQSDFTAELGLTKGAISQAVNRVWSAHVATSLPEGFEKVTAILPKDKAFIVKKWAKAAAEKMESEK